MKRNPGDYNGKNTKVYLAQITGLMSTMLYSRLDQTLKYLSKQKTICTYVYDINFLFVKNLINDLLERDLHSQALVPE